MRSAELLKPSTLQARTLRGLQIQDSALITVAVVDNCLSPHVGYIFPWLSAADTDVDCGCRQVVPAQREPHLTAFVGAQVNPLKTTQTSYWGIVSCGAFNVKLDHFGRTAEPLCRRLGW